MREDELTSLRSPFSSIENRRSTSFFDLPINQMATRLVLTRGPNWKVLYANGLRCAGAELRDSPHVERHTEMEQ